MRQETRKKFNEYCHCVALANNTESSAVKFSVEPTIQQKLEEQVQLSSSFLQKINMIGVHEQQGAALQIGVSDPIAGTTDTSKQDRETRDIHSLSENTYHCQKIDYDSHVNHATLDAWAKFPDFANKIASAKSKRIALDRIMIGFNGEKRAKTSDRKTNKLLQDVAKGWLAKIKEHAPERCFDATSVGVIDSSNTRYKNLDALVMSAVDDLIAEEFRDGTDLVAILSRDLLADKYFPLVNTNEKPTETLAADIVMSQKRVGGLPAVTAPYVPRGSILITPLNNLSIYYQISAQRRYVIDNPKRDRIEDYLSSNDDYVIENYKAAALITGIKLPE